jgi:hypothetical protein
MQKLVGQAGAFGIADCLEVSFPLSLVRAIVRDLGQGKNDDLFAANGADIVVKA